MLSPFSGQTMREMLPSKLGASYPQPQGPAFLSPQESRRDYKIEANMRTKDFMGHVVTAVVLPGDEENTQHLRTLEFFRQSAMPWGNTFMATPTDTKRLNNPQQKAFVSQRQLTIPSSYGQFYAFMHAMAAAFGNLTSR